MLVTALAAAAAAAAQDLICFSSDYLRAADMAHAPGTGCSGTRAWARAAASSAPGSEIPGVPASLITATLLPCGPHAWMYVYMYVCVYVCR